MFKVHDWGWLYDKLLNWLFWFVLLECERFGFHSWLLMLL